MKQCPLDIDTMQLDLGIKIQTGVTLNNSKSRIYPLKPQNKNCSPGCSKLHMNAIGIARSINEKCTETSFAPFRSTKMGFTRYRYYLFWKYITKESHFRYTNIPMSTYESLQFPYCLTCPQQNFRFLMKLSLFTVYTWNNCTQIVESNRS